MASRNITCTISSALNDLQFLDNIRPPWDRHGLRSMKEWLRFLRTFLLAAMKWCNKKNKVDIHHASLGALVARIEDAISKRGEEIHSLLNMANLQQEFTDSVYDVTFGLKRDTESFEQEIKECYLVFSDCSSRQSGSSPVRKDELMEFVDSLLENLGDILHWQVDEARDAIELIKALKEKLTFLKNFIHFVTLRGDEDRQLAPLLTHLEAVAVSVAGLSFRCRNIMIEKLNVETDNSGYWELLQMEIRSSDYWVLLQKIVPVEICKALLASNVSTRSYKKIDEHILRDFVVLLLSNLWEILKSGTCLMILLKDQLQTLYEGLRSLRTILKEKPKKFDDEMRDLIGLVFCDAGLVIFSVALNAMKDGSVKDMDVVSFDLLEKIKLIQETVAEECPKTSSFNFPRTNPLGFIDFLLKHMEGLTSPEAGSATLVNRPVQALREDFVYLRSFLGQIVELCNEDEELQELWDRVVGGAYRVEFLIDSLRVGDDPDSCSLLFDSISEEIKIIKAEALKICDSKRLDGEVKEATKRLNDMPSQESKPIINDVVVGFEDEAASIINRLLRGSHKLQIVSIVGMPGLGKTTLARKVYNDSSVNSYFYTRAWCTVSQVYHKKNLLLEILNCILFKLSDKYFKMSEEDLVEELYRRLKRNKYLIVLDDVWDVEAWKGLEASFPDDENGSRVIFTSRLRDVVPQDKLDQEPHSLRQLTHDESWKLLKEKLFLGKELPPKLCEFRMQILEMCQGLPLTIVILAGILANTDQCGWKEVVESLSSRAVSTTEQCIATLGLSYKNLPENLKPCFLYFGAFPEDHEHTTERLIWLWAAEGFAQQTQLKSSEDVANDYMMDLIGRSLVTISKQRSIGGVKNCRIHDLLHECCVTKAKEENFLYLIRGNEELCTFEVPHYLRRLCINSEPEHFCESRLFSPTIRSLLFFRHGKMDTLNWFDLSFIFHIYKLLRVLDVSQIHFGNTFPKEIELLVQLRYLALRGEIESIPSSIANLCNLETFIVESFRAMVSLPDTIWNLKKLRHLQIKDKLLLGFGFVLPTDNLDDAAQLCDLDTFSSAILSSWENMDKIFRKFPNIRQLKCKLLEFGNSAWDGRNRIVVLDNLSQLESLNLNINTYCDLEDQIEFQFSLTIRKLTLSGFRLPWCKISAIAELPNLEVLKLLDQAFMGKQWNMEEEEFPKLRFLKLASSNVVNWTAFECEECFPRLQKLVLERCPRLEEIPSSLGNISTLEMIEVVDCPNCASSVEAVLEEQLSMGNTDMQIKISSSETDY